jgi:hypothetical protein
MRRLAVALMFVLACGKNNEPPPPSSGSPTAKPESGPSHKPPVAAMSPAEQASRLFGTLCANCHGGDGTGNTPIGQQLNPKPRNYTDAAWQASVSDDDIRKAIVGGGTAIGKSNVMPPNPDLADKPEVVNALVAIIRGFKK